MNTSNRLEDGWKRFIYVTRINEPDKLIEVDWEWAEQFIERASATTVRKFQGDQKRLIIYVKAYHTQYDTNEDAYTALSRSTEIAYYIGNKDDLSKSILNPENPRRSNLSRIILEKLSKFKNAFETPDLSYVHELEKKEENEREHKDHEKKTIKASSIFKTPDVSEMIAEDTKNKKNPNTKKRSKDKQKGGQQKISKFVNSLGDVI